MKSPYTYVKRASEQDKQEMQAIVDSLNELTPESVEITGVLTSYSLVKLHDCYAIKADFDYDTTEYGSIVRCGHCNSIRDLWDGQIEFCTECWQDW